MTIHTKKFRGTDLQSLQHACSVLRRNKRCYSIEVTDDGWYILMWFEYKQAVAKGRPVGSGR